MNRTNQALLSGAVIAAATMLSVGIVSAYRGDPNVQGPNYNPERHTAMTSALASEDYAAWKSLMAGKDRVATLITEETFPRFVEAHRKMLAGDKAGADAIRAELGLGQGKGNGNGHGRRAGHNGDCPYMQ
jgi:hypothetical protein